MLNLKINISNPTDIIVHVFMGELEIKHLNGSGWSDLHDAIEEHCHWLEVEQGNQIGRIEVIR